MLPDNLVKLHDGEEALRAESIRLIESTPDTLHHVQMIERTMDLIHELLNPADGADQDDLAIKVLGIRLFNTLAVVLKTALSGYYQAAAAQLRDALETAYLLDYFTTDRRLIAAWRTLPDKEREKRFKPVAVRRALDERDGFTTQKRGAAYKQFCRLATHPNPDSVTMLVPTGDTAAHYGPFLDRAGLDAVIAETALTGVQGVQMFRLLVRATEVRHLRAKLDFLEAEADWAERFFGQKRDRSKLEGIRSFLQGSPAQADR